MRNPYAYLRDSWNYLDCFVVIMGFVTLVPSVANVSAIRALRVFRVLRTVTVVPGLKRMVNALIRCVKSLGDVMVLIIFAVIVLAIVGTQLFMGAFRHKCVAMPDAGFVGGAPGDYEAWINDASHYVPDEEENDGFRLCGNNTGALWCPGPYTFAGGPTYASTSCLAVGETVNFGYTSYDNVLWSMLTVFQLVTLDFWEDVYNKSLACIGSVSVIYYIITVFFGAFFLLNLVLAVVASNYCNPSSELGRLADVLAGRDKDDEENEGDSEVEDAPAAEPPASPATPEPSTTNAADAVAHAMVHGAEGCWKRWCALCAGMVDKSWYEALIITVIIINTTAMSMEYPSQSDVYGSVLEVINFICRSEERSCRERVSY